MHEGANLWPNVPARQKVLYDGGEPLDGVILLANTGDRASTQLGNQ